MNKILLIIALSLSSCTIFQKDCKNYKEFNVSIINTKGSGFKSTYNGSTTSVSNGNEGIIYFHLDSESQHEFQISNQDTTFTKNISSASCDDVIIKL
jgi:DnaJ-class molecular chaperone